MAAFRSILGWRLRPIAGDRPGQMDCDLHASPLRRPRSPGFGMAALLAGSMLLGSVCCAPDAVSALPAPDAVLENLLHTIVRQISGGLIISPPDDNAMQTWQRVLQRDIVLARSPEVIRALADFDTYARARAAEETAAGRVLVAAELTVFADQAARMSGRIPADATSAADGNNAQPAPASVPNPAGPEAPTSAPDGSARTSSDDPAPAVQGTGLPLQAANRTASVTDAVIHVASQTQRFGVAATAPGLDERHERSVGDGGTTAAAPVVASADQTPPSSVSVPAPGAEPAARSDMDVSAAAAPSTADAGHGDGPFGRLAGQPTLPSPAEPTAQTAASPQVAQASLGHPAAAYAGPATALPTDRAVAAFYAARGDAMLELKDISAARKFYEFAANAGSPRAATALARTYDPAFAAQFRGVGVRPDSAQAASWYRKAEELGSKTALLSQRNDPDK